MQYKASFVMSAVGQLLLTFVEFLTIWALFDRFGSLRGWTLPEVAFFYGIVHTAFSFAEGVVRGFDVFPAMIKSGDFDRMLVRPRGTLFQVASQEVQMMRIGRLIQGIVILLWSASALDIDWTAFKILFTLGAIMGGIFIFSGFFVLQATLAFWTIESLEIVNTVTYGGVESAQFPLSIYRDWFRKFFTYVIPLACVNYFPALLILGKDDPFGTSKVVMLLSPLLGFIFFYLCTKVWQFGVRRYTSTGS